MKFTPSRNEKIDYHTSKEKTHKISLKILS